MAAHPKPRSNSDPGSGVEALCVRNTPESEVQVTSDGRRSDLWPVF
jgi:hypothetical protein